MKKIIYYFLLLFILNSCGKSVKDQKVHEKSITTEINFNTSDGVTVYGDLYATSKESSTILLFHQGGSNSKGEYHTIIPKLIEKGYNILAIDLRQGGQTYGNYNRTVANISNNEYAYCDAYPDLEGALDYLINEGYSGNKILWGSSYSASLVVKLANNRSNEITAVLAFSPASGGPMQACRARDFFETLKTPLFLLRPKQEMEIESVQQQFELAQQYNFHTYVAENGTHGSSMLVRERVENDVTNTWKAVFDFLNNL